MLFSQNRIRWNRAEMRERTVPVFIVLLSLVALVRSDEFDLFIDIDHDADALPSAILKGAGEAYALNMRGIDALDSGDLDQAIEYFTQACGILPIYSDGENNLGVAYFRKGSVAMAVETWERVVARDPAYAIAYHNLGIAARAEKRHDHAIRQFERAVKENKRFVDAWVMLGRTRLLVGKRREALHDLGKAYKIKPRNADVWSSYAYCLIQTGDTSQAQSILNRHRDHAYALRTLGQIEALRGNTMKAAGLLTKAYGVGQDRACLVQLARVYVDAGECRDGLTVLKEYFGKATPSPADAWLLAAQAAKECGDIPGTRTYLEKGMKLFPHDPILRFNLGQVCFYLGDYAGANAAWSALPDTIQDARLFYMRALAERHLGNMKQAEQHARRAVSMDSKPEYHDLLGVVLHRQGDTEKARLAFRRALVLDPSLVSAQLNLALLDKSAGDLDAAVKEVEAQVASCTDSCVESLLRLSILYYHKGEPGRAVAVLEGIPSADRTSRIYRHLAIYYRSRGQWGKAIRVLEEARRKHTVGPEMMRELADVLLEAGMYSRAVSVLNDLLTKCDSDPWRIHYQLGYAYLRLNDLGKAAGFLERSVGLNPGNAAARGLLAFVYNRRGDTRAARALWETTLKHDPSNSSLWINLGLLLEQEGDPEGALEKYRKAATLNPDDKAVYVNMGNAYLSMNKTSEALESYLKALASSRRMETAYNAFTAALKIPRKRTADRMLGLLTKEYPGSEFAHRAAAELALFEGDTVRAVQLLGQISEKGARDWHLLARAHLALGHVDLAEQALGRLPDTGEWREECRGLGARIAFLQGRYDDALEVWLEQADTSFDAGYNVLLALYNAERYESALVLAEKLAGRARGGNLRDVCRVAGNAAVRSEDWGAAESWLGKLEGLAPDDPRLLFNRAIVAYNTDRIRDAWEYYGRARKLDPSLRDENIEKRYEAATSGESLDSVVFDSLDILYNDALLLQNDGRDSSAAEIYEKILSRDKGYYRAWNNLGAIHGANGDLDRAIDCYRKAVSRRSELADGFANLVNIFLALDDTRNAKKWLGRGLKHNPDSEILHEMSRQVEALGK